MFSQQNRYRGQRFCENIPLIAYYKDQQRTFDQVVFSLLTLIGFLRIVIFHKGVIYSDSKSCTF